MADIEALIKSIIVPLIEEPDALSIEVIESDDFIEYHIHLAPEDIGRVIGRKGRVVRAIRTIVYSIRTKGKKRTRIVIVDDNEE